MNEALQLLRQERANAAQQVELGIGDRCRGFLADGEAKCSDAIGDIMDRYIDKSGTLV